MHRAGVIKNFPAAGRRIGRQRAMRCEPHRARAKNGGQGDDQECFRFHNFSCFRFQLPLFVRRRVISDSSRAQNSVERTKATVSGPGHTAGGGWKKSDEPGAIPRVKRRAIRHQGQPEGRANQTHPVFRQDPGHDGRSRNRKLFLRSGVGRDRRHGLRAGRWRGATTHPAAATTAGMSRLGRRH
jgi:hypothetical protein